MEKIPFYAILGNGKLAQHFCHYFSLLKLPYQQWYRQYHTLAELHHLLSITTHALVLISDSQITAFIDEHITPHFSKLICIHCAGSLSIKQAYLAHPLQTFSTQLYTLSEYKKIPFIIEKNAPAFCKLLPKIPNPHVCISHKDFAYYHAHCVMANNFTTLLWQKFFKEMTMRFHIPAEQLEPFLQQTFHNISSHPLQALTGPLQRRDHCTLQNNLRALRDDDFYAIYKVFMQTFSQETRDE